MTTHPQLGPFVLVLIGMAAGACSKPEAKPAPEPQSASAAASTTETTAAVQPRDDKKKRSDALETLAGLKTPVMGESRDKACDAMRTLAGAANDCADCRKAYAKAIVDFSSADLGICSAEELPQIKEDAPAMCEALVSAYGKKPSAVLLGGITTQQATCSPQFDKLVTTVTAQMKKYDDKYGDISLAHLAYLERLSEHMTPAQKASLSAAAKVLATKAKAKKRDHMVESVERLTKKLG